MNFRSHQYTTKTSNSNTLGIHLALQFIGDFYKIMLSEDSLYHPEQANTVATFYIIPAIEQAKYHGIDVDQLLQTFNIPAQLLAEPKARITSNQYAGLMTSLMRLLDDEFLLLGGKRRTRMGTFAMMCHTIISCPTLSKAIHRSLQFYNLFLDDIQMKLRKRGDQVIATFKINAPEDDSHIISTECSLVIIHRLTSWLINHRIELLGANFIYEKPSHAEEYNRLFRCPIQFNQEENSIIFPAKYLKYPLQQDVDSLKEFLRYAPGNLLMIPEKNDSLSAQIRAILGTDFRRDFPDFETVAQKLNSTPQTLRRHLKEENTSYQEIKDKLRRDASIYYLNKQHLSINEITELMGFSEPSTFHRAFKKWTGLTPGVYRQEVANGTTTKSSEDK